MYRHHQMEQDSSDAQFVTRLYDLPVVHSAVDKLGAFYTGTKERNRLFRFTLQTAESGFGLVVNTAKPVAAKFEKQIGALNGIACNQLERMERDYPIITQPTDVVLKQTKETCSSAVRPITERVKPVTDRVGSVTQYGLTKMNDAKVYTYDTIDGVKVYTYDKIDGVKTYSVNKVNGVKTYGMDTFTAATNLGARQVSRLLDNEAGRVLLTKMDMAIDMADTYVDRYLPEDEMTLATETMTQRKSKKLEMDELSKQTLVANKALELSCKVRRRAYNHAAKRLKIVKMRSLETVDKLHFNVNLIEYARNNLDGVKNKVCYVWDEINKTPDQLSDETDQEQTCQNVTYERRAIATARHLTQRLKTSLSDLGVERVPAFIRGQVEKAINLASSLFQLFSSRAKTGLTDEDMDVVKNSVDQLRTTLTSFDPAAAIKNLPTAASNTVTSVANAASNAFGNVTEFASNSATKIGGVASKAVTSVKEGSQQEMVELKEKVDQYIDDPSNVGDDDVEDDEEEDEEEAHSGDEKYDDHSCVDHEGGRKDK